jgi:valyl-tRNA synthetase
LVDAEAEGELGWLVRLIGGIRTARSELNEPPSAKLKLLQQDANETTLSRLERNAEAIERLARVELATQVETRPPAASLAVLVDEATFALPVGEVVDLAAERARLGKEIAKAEAEADKLEARLGNADFVAKAPEEVVEEQRERLRELRELIAKLKAALRRIS